MGQQLVGGNFAVLDQDNTFTGTNYFSILQSRLLVQIWDGTGTNNGQLTCPGTLAATVAWLLQNYAGNIVMAGTHSSPAATDQVARVNLTGQTATIAATIIATPSTAFAELWRVSYFLRCTTADATAGSVTFKLNYTDSVGATQDASAAVVLTSTASKASGVFVFDRSSGDVTWQVDLTGLAGSSDYKIRVRCEYLG